MTTSEHPRRRWGLMASVALNVALIGAIAGHVLAGDGRDNRMRPPMHSSLAFREMPREFRSRVKQEFQDQRAFMRGQSEKIGALRFELAGTLEAPEFDETAVQAVIARYLTLMGETQSASADIFVSAIKKMSNEERAAFASNLKKRRGR